VGEELLEGAGLHVAVHRVAVGEVLEVHAVGVELGPVHAGELASPVDAHPAAAAHARAVDHDRVEADHGPYAVGAGRLRDRPHHRDGPDGEDVVDPLARREQGLQPVRDQPLLAVASVVRRHVKGVARRPDLVLEDDELAGAAAQDRDYPVPGLLQGHRGRVGDGRPDAAADDAGGPEALHLRGLSEGTDDIEDGLAFPEGVEELRGLADALDHDRDVAPLGVRVGDRDRDALAVVVDPEDHELARLALAGDPGGLDPEELHVGSEEACFEYLEHGRMG
jgi:hypothetical protein